MKNKEPIITTSRLGFKTEEADFSQNLSIQSTSVNAFQEKWKPVWGQSSEIENSYNSLTVHLSNSKGDLIRIEFRVFNDGFGFRYAFPEQSNHHTLTIRDELTEFGMSGNHTAWWVPGCWDNDEYVYTQSKLGEVDASYFQKGYPYSHATTITNKNAVNTPVTMKTSTGKYISIHEAALIGFPGMSLLVDTMNYTFKSHLAEDEIHPNVKATIRFHLKPRGELYKSQSLRAH